MLKGSCHCGAVKIQVPRKPRRLTSCNCSICRRHGGLFGYYNRSEVKIVARRGALDRYAEEAARFYADTFPDSFVGAVYRAPGDFPSGKKGDVLTVEFTVMGIPCLGLNGGPAFTQNEAFSFQVATTDQAETDRYWNAIVGNGGQESACGWCKDKWGLSWQITPVALTRAIADPDPAAAKRAFDAMMDRICHKNQRRAIEAALPLSGGNSSEQARDI